MLFRFKENEHNGERVCGEHLFFSYRYNQLCLTVYVDHEREPNERDLIGEQHDYLITKVLSKAKNGVPDTIFLARKRETDIPLRYTGFYDKPGGGVISLAEAEIGYEEQVSRYTKLFLSPGRFQKWLGRLNDIDAPNQYNPGLMYGELHKGRRNYRATGIVELSDLFD